MLLVRYSRRIFVELLSKFAYRLGMSACKVQTHGPHVNLVSKPLDPFSIRNLRYTFVRSAQSHGTSR